MDSFPSGVTSYVVGVCTVRVAFPVDQRGTPHVCCAQCEYYSRTSARCRLNNRICEFPEKYRGSYCPLNFEERTMNNEFDPE